MYNRLRRTNIPRRAQDGQIPVVSTSRHATADDVHLGRPQITVRIHGPAARIAQTAHLQRHCDEFHTARDRRERQATRAPVASLLRTRLSTTHRYRFLFHSIFVHINSKL